jgi:uncharacterized delta-60 repeat protein
MRTSVSPARRHLGRRIAACTGAVLLAPVLAALGTTPANAAPGDPDPAFAGGGRTALGNGWRVVALDDLTDDRFVTVSIRPSDTDSLDVRRFTPTGVADPSFAGDGNVQVGGPVSWVAPAVAVDRNGLTYVSAFADNPGFSRVWRFTGAGALDPSWGAGTGRVDFNGSRFLDIALQPDGRLVVANGASVYRLTSAGAVDTTFGASGGTTLGTGQIDSLQTLADGSIVAAGRSTTSVDVFRLGRSGGIDADFGAAGRATYRPTPPLGWAVAGIQGVTVGVQNDGRVVVATGIDEQNATNGNHRFPLLVTRFTKGGGTDARFTTTRDYAFSVSGRLSIQADDKVIVPIVDGPRASLLRLEPDGRRDSTFGTNGGWTDPQVDTRPTATLVQRPGRIVVTGVATGQTGLLWAFRGDPTPKCEGRYATAYGGSASDVLVGGDGDDVIVGGKGKDSIEAGAGADRVCGGQGKDSLVGGSGRDRLVGGGDADQVRGYGGGDRLDGGGGADRLYGGDGQDKITGGQGDDRLYGGPGHDRLHGGPGRNQIHP